MIDPVAAEPERAIRERRDDGEDARALSSAAPIAHTLSRYHTPLRRTSPFVRTLAAKVARVHGPHNERLIELDQIVAELAETLKVHIDDEEATPFPALARPEAGRRFVRGLLKTMRVRGHPSSWRG